MRSVERKQSKSMTVVVQSDETASKQLIPVMIQDFQKCLPNDFRDRTLDPQLDDTGKVRAPECEHAGKVQVLSDDYVTVIAGVIKDGVVGVAEVTDVRPMGGIDSVGSEVIAPAWREILIDDQIHDASS